MCDVLVLCYHAVSPTWEASLSVTPERFEQLVRRGFTGSTFTEAIARPATPRTLAVTFDDAYRSVLELAFPILDRLGLPGTVFVPSFAGREEPTPGPHLTDNQRPEYHRRMCARLRSGCRADRSATKPPLTRSLLFLARVDRAGTG